METAPGQAVPVRQTVAANVARLRKDRQLTVRQLSAELEALGHRLLPSAVTKIEQGTRSVDVEDLVALAVALRVNPSALLLPPVAGNEPVLLTPTKAVEAGYAWRWADGLSPLPRGHTGWGDNPEEDLDDWQLYARPGVLRRLAQHPLQQAVSKLSTNAARLLHESKTPPALLDFLRRDLERVALELTEVEESWKVDDDGEH